MAGILPPSRRQGEREAVTAMTNSIKRFEPGLRARRGSRDPLLFPARGAAVRRHDPHFHKQAGACYWNSLGTTTGLCAPKLPMLPPRVCRRQSRPAPVVCRGKPNSPHAAGVRAPRLPIDQTVRCAPRLPNEFDHTARPGTVGSAQSRHGDLGAYSVEGKYGADIDNSNRQGCR